MAKHGTNQMMWNVSYIYKSNLFSENTWEMMPLTTFFVPHDKFIYNIYVYFKFILVNLQIETSRITGFHLLMVQFYAMLMKKIIVTYRSRMLLITQLIIPTAMLIIAILVIRNHKQQDSLPSLALDIRQYPGSISLINQKGIDEIANKTTNSLENFFTNIKKPLNSIGSVDFEEYMLKKVINQQNFYLVF